MRWVVLFEPHLVRDMQLLVAVAEPSAVEQEFQSVSAEVGWRSPRYSVVLSLASQRVADNRRLRELELEL